MPIKVTGGPQIRRRMAVVQEDLTRKLKTSGKKQAERIMAVSKAQFVPIDTGDLKDTGRVETTTRLFGFKFFSWELLYGGINGVDYAVIQHEDLSFHHTHGGPKYLERPFLAASRSMAASIRDDVRFV